jgi:hypothetical protein
MAQRQQELFPLIQKAQTALAFTFAPEPRRAPAPTKTALTGAAIALLRALHDGETTLYSHGEKFEKPWATAGRELSKLGFVFMREELAPSQYAWEISDKGRRWLAS